MSANLSRRRWLAAAALLPAAFALPRAGRAASRRIVCAGGAMTECVFALGHGPEVVAVDTTSLYPAAVHALPKIGYFRQLSVEGLLSLSPDLVLADRDAGPASVLQQLGGATNILRQFDGPLSPASVPDKMRFVAAALGEAGKGEEVAGDIAADMRTLADAVARVEVKPRTIFMLGTIRGRMAGRHTAADMVMAIAGAENLGDDFDGYRPLSAEGIVSLKPDVVLTMFQSNEMPVAGVDLAARAAEDLGLAELPDAARPRVIPIDGAALLAMGPRTAHAAYALAAQLHPDLDWPSLPARPWVA
ncbi:iron complex transport system substrate-binding protein [Dongia mobilis]|uniref:Iron complex transport system substrate-binding protein n=1 Tax=Dongia mobilis TaxID=578943 RepID=A0A4R6WLD5_9PROT|nr:ABC transporter substrate-binding protein [Dongia mobilis]TDQ78797.1 iron complex transport system substrate-binding protein [Dongia mobilis]